jgi:hypothetical protein
MERDADLYTKRSKVKGEFGERIDLGQVRSHLVGDGFLLFRLNGQNLFYCATECIADRQ